MSATTTRSDIRTRVRDYLYEASADWFSDAQLNRLIAEEVRALPSNDIYLEAVYSTNLVVDRTDYSLPDGTKKVERAERNDGNLSVANWVEFAGYDLFNNAIYLDFRPSNTDEIRIFIKKEFTVPTDDVTALNVPDDVCEIVVWGVVVRAYKMAIGYLRNAQNWDSVAKPDYLTLNTLNSWLSEAKRDYRDLIKMYQTVPRPREIGLVS